MKLCCEASSTLVCPHLFVQIRLRSLLRLFFSFLCHDLVHIHRCVLLCPSNLLLSCHLCFRGRLALDCGTSLVRREPG